MANGLIDIPEGMDRISIKKRLGVMMAEARQKAKPDKCILCGKEKSSFCNSHSVPKMSLKNIADDGKLLLASQLIGLEEIVDSEKGVNNSGTFHYICNECDSSFFQDYENEDNIAKAPTDKMLAEIAVKNILLQLNKRAQEKELIKIQQRDFRAFVNPQDYFDVKEMDYQELLEELSFHKRIADEDIKGGYRVLFWRLLPYKVPIAMQSALVLRKDMEGIIVNDTHDFSPKTRMQYMHLAVFPLQESSVVLTFHHKRDHLYRRLWHQINISSDDKVLQFLNYLIFSYTENYFISKTIRKELKENKKLIQLSQEEEGIPRLGLLGADNMFGIGYTPVNMDEIPNFLSREWAVCDEPIEAE